MTDTLNVDLSGDAWNGDAQAVISINGVPTGGILDIAAVNGADDVSSFTFTGDFGANPLVAVSFINDASSGLPGEDRNLYLDGFTYDGVAQLSDKAVLDYDQTVSYQLTAAEPPSERAADFLDGLGVVVHIEDLDTSYASLPRVEAAVQSLGITHLRVGVPDANTLPEMLALGAMGITFDVLMPASSSTALLPAQISAIDAIAPYVASIEGPNEVNLSSDFSWNGQGGDAAAIAYQQALYTAVKGDPSLSGASVYTFSLGAVGEQGYQALGNLSAVATDGNAHVYYPDGEAPAGIVQFATGNSQIPTPSLPTAITETNYASADGTDGSVDQSVQARYDLDLLMDAAKDGVAQTYLYELLDEFPDPGNTNDEFHYGLFNADGSPKPVAIDIHNLTTILADPASNASTFAPGSLDYSIAGLPASGDTLVLQKSDGTFDLVVWAEPEIWNAATDTEVEASARTVEVTLPSVVGSISVFDPLIGTAAIAQYTNASSVSVTVTDHPIIIEIGAAPAATPPVPAAITVGSGPDTVDLTLSEDAYLGDAQFTVSVDGTQVGGILSVQALHQLGQTEDVLVEGDWGAGKHTVSVDFINDLYGGTPQDDRNLYVTGVSYDGNVTAGATLTERGDGTQSVTVDTPAPASISAGSGSDVIHLTMSEDAYLGDAQFTVSVDGVQVGGVLSIQATRAAGQQQDVFIDGNWGPGEHSLTVNFLNDLYGGSPQADRNLYVDATSYDGISVAGGTINLTADGPQTEFVGTPVQTTVGSGSDTIDLKMSQDPFLDDAQFTISVDGVQVGGTMSVDASKWLGLDQDVLVMGNWGNGQHVVTVNFINDLYGGSYFSDRNLFVDNVSYDGVVQPGATLGLYSDGPQSLTVGTPIPSTMTIGSGSDVLDLKVSEDAYLGDARFAVSVNGHLVGGVQTAQASHGGGDDQDVLVQGNWGQGPQTVVVTFLNDAYAGTPQTDRNLYVDGASYDGTAVAGATLALYCQCSQGFSFATQTAGTPGATVSAYGGDPQSLTAGAPIPTMTLGSGPDILDLKVAEDAYLGNALFTVSVDGQQVGDGVQMAQANHAAGADQDVELQGNWGAGQHTVTVDFLNDAYAGTPQTDRNLFVDAGTYDGAAISGATLALYSQGTQGFSFTTATTYAPGAAGGAITTLGNDTVNAGSGAVTINADGPSVNVTGGSGAMTFIAASGAVNLTGGTGALTFTAGTGAAAVTAGSGAETFDVIAGQAGGSLTIAGFTPGTDLIHLQGYGAGAVTSQQVTAGSTQIVLADNTHITLTGFTNPSATIFG